MSRVLVTGSVAYDLLLSYDGAFTDGIDPDALEQMSLAFVTPHFEKHHGGTGANIAWYLNLLGADPLLVSSVGQDGGSYLELLRERGIDTKQVQQIPTAMTATAILATDSAERHIIFFHPGADAQGSWPDIADDRESLSYAIVSPRDATLMTEALRWCNTYAVPVIFDPGQQLMAFGDDELRRCIESSTALIANAYEWSVLTERLNTTAEDLLTELKFIVVTRGEAGATIYTADGEIAIGACQADVVKNPTGAGDAFRAGLLAGLSAGWSLEQAGKLGAAVGSYAVESVSTMADSLDLGQLQQRALEAYGESLPELT